MYVCIWVEILLIDTVFLHITYNECLYEWLNKLIYYNVYYFGIVFFFHEGGCSFTVWSPADL